MKIIRSRSTLDSTRAAMRKFTILSTLIISLISASIFGFGYAMAFQSPFRPGSLLYPLQDSVEQMRINLAETPADQAELSIHLASLRLDDLSDLAGTSRQQAALHAFSAALNRSIYFLGNLNKKQVQFDQLQSVLDELAQRAEEQLSKIDPASTEDPAFFAQLQIKVNTLRRMLEEPGTLQQVILLPSPEVPNSSEATTPNQPEPTPVGIVVMFPPGSKGAEHAFFRLEGQHADLPCASCHAGGQYAGTSDRCVDCHQRDMPIDHSYSLPDCTECHIAYAWNIIDYDHKASLVKDCSSCHAQERPISHYKAVCSACHSTSAWRPASFNHQAVNTSDCQSCHATNKPAGHYGAQCSACHSTSAWRPASFNHQVVNTSDCQSCHAASKPAGHYGAQCSACHSTSAWRPAAFDHAAAGATDCAACHAGSRPAGHYSGQCSACHSTSSWQGASFNHSFPTNHGDAGGDCTRCHPSGGSGWSCYTCHDQGKMANKHAEKNILDISGCLSCHPQGNKEDD